ncbi:TonB-dependent receptor domain-containing protein [Steroidobacter agaridevorans]|uniref:TonB-dependent receptor domain-containing protein n=1 Tax=Steroidobacter agaridevorans TaxID=2695856 RepID=UPI0013265860|nr:TonB-dependent receptor [Steroidobacter agaridevorans]GFE88921.1 TonB-dependent receptor [Steroidobacter agaridevorans]
MRIRVVPLAAIAVAASAPAWAQTAPASDVVDTIVVTGSRIARPELERLQPTVVVSSDDIENRGAPNVIEVLNDIPAFGPPASSSAGTQPSAFGVAQSFADFFSLGSQRTLTLVNGRRFVSSNTASIFGPADAGQQVDLNAIPTQLIDRVEVIAVGGAPVYGSDAIAGTVNIILKRDYEGADVDASFGQSARGDADNYRLRALAGTNFADGRGNVTMSAEYARSEGLMYMDRSRTARGLYYTTPEDPDSPYVNELIEQRRVDVVTAGGLPLIDDSLAQFAGILDATGNTLQFGPGGALVPYNFGTGTGNLVNKSAGDGFNVTAVSTLLAPTERANFTALGNFQITDRVRAFGEAWYSTTSGKKFADQPVYNSLLFGPGGSPEGNLIVSTDNPFLSAESRALIRDNLLAAGADPSFFYLARANSDLQSGLARSESNVYRVVAGLEGAFDIGERSFQWEIAGNYGNSETTSREPMVVQQNFENAMDAVIDAATGQIVCRGTLNGTLESAPIRTRSDSCAPLNLFGVGSPSQAARDYITTLAMQTSTVTQRVVTADISGEIVDLPGGAVQAVVGVENRRETSRFDPDRFFREAWGRLVPIDGLSGEFETDEAFTELLIPIVGEHQNIPFVNALQVEGAARYVDHSVAGGDLTWTAGARFAPIPDIQFRGNKTLAIRSPAITEAFVPTSSAFDTADDPCDSRFIDAGPNPATRAANCAAAGITQPFQSNIVDASAQVSVSGNPDLLNEEADSRTWGVVLRPRWVPSLSLAVDWIEIDLTNAIVALNAVGVMNACYDSEAGIGATALCDNIDRDASGQVTFVRTGYANAGSKRFKAITAQLNYGVGLGRFGRLDTSLNFYNLRNLTTRVGLGDLDRQAGEVGTSRDQGSLTLNYSVKDLSLSLQTQYMGPARWDVDEQIDTRNFAEIGEWWLFNLSAGYRLNENITTRVFVDNVFDREAPFPVPAAGGTVAYYDGIFGRSYAMSVNYTF